MENLNLVLGANGHLGNTLVRQLLANNKQVRASMRNLNDRQAFKNPNCEIVYADMLEKNSLVKAMQGVDILYIAAAVYKSWANNIKKEIIDANIEGTRNVIEAAAEQHVKRIIYVSTTFTLDPSDCPMNEAGWNKGKTDAYTYSKIEAEKLAWKLSRQYNLWMISILPSGMIGPDCYDHLTPTMEFLDSILKNKMPVDPCFNFNMVDVRDVAATMIRASDIANCDERYILAQCNPISSTDVFKLAHAVYPSVKIPKKASFQMLYLIGSISELISKLSRKKPLMLRLQVKNMYNADLRYNTSKARNELDFNPRKADQALKEAFKYLLNNY